MTRKKDAEISALRGAIGWLQPPFVNERTSHAELKKRVQFMLEDVERFYAQAIEARRAETTQIGSVEDESAVRKDAPNNPIGGDAS